MTRFFFSMYLETSTRKMEPETCQPADCTVRAAMTIQMLRSPKQPRIEPSTNTIVPRIIIFFRDTKSPREP